ncbi:MAG: steroid 5-alpha reductase [Desulfuromonas sp.]|nr:MAG: steroid 5-alpha reductase [Desulfuromonas sp.]
MAIFSFTTLLIFVTMTLIFVIAMAIKDNSIVDIFYGLVFLVGCWGAAIHFGLSHQRQLLILAVLTLWGCRLAIHLFLRKKGHGEDFRYAKWREDWGKTFVWRSYLQIFMLQGAVILLISTPVLLVIRAPGGPLTLLDFLGITIWLLGFLFEAIGDWQLLIFKRKPENKGRIMRYGIWQYTRHPNYFGEATLWWGVFLIGLSAENGVYGIISPLLIAFLLLKVSGIPMLEKKYEGDPEFKAYRKKTNAFFPWFPKPEITIPEG